MATVKAVSAVHVAVNASCARSRDEFRAVAENAEADAASCLRTRPHAAESITGCVRAGLVFWATVVVIFPLLSRVELMGTTLVGRAPRRNGRNGES
jgi:hypothetical protein